MKFIKRIAMLTFLALCMAILLMMFALRYIIRLMQPLNPIQEQENETHSKTTNS